MQTSDYSPYPCAQRFLLRVNRLNELIACKCAFIRAMESRVGGTDLGCRVTGSAPADRTAYMALKISELQEEVEALQRQRSLAHTQIARMAQRMPNPRLTCLLEMRYLSCLTWETISAAMHLTLRTVMRQHTRALRLVEYYLAAEEGGE